MAEGIRSYLKDCITGLVDRQSIPVFYFDKHLNVGDLLTPYLVERITGRRSVLVRSRARQRIMGVGSILHFSNSRSLIWGSGIISPERTPPGNHLACENIKALRGKHTRELIANRVGCSIDVPLGDPAVLMPDYFKPGEVSKIYRVGIVPHYCDEDLVRKIIPESSDVKIVSVRQQPEDFIRELLECESVLSSSLHGLILADAYGIKNRWVVLSDNVIGGDFKFMDYYSTTTAVDEKPVVLRSAEELLSILGSVDKYVTLKNYKEDRSQLRNALLSAVKALGYSHAG